MTETRVAANKTFNSKYANTDFDPAQHPRDVVSGAYSSLDLMFQEKQYYDTLMARSALLEKDRIRILRRQADGTSRVVEVNPTELVQPVSEFEEARMDAIIRLNRATEAQRKTYMLRFETESMAELAEKIANFIIDRKMKQGVFDEFTA